MPAPASAPDRSGLLRLSAGRVYVRDQGPTASDAASATPRLLLHDFALCSHTWSEVLPSMTRHCRVVAPDLPGTGNSDRPPPERADGYSLAWLRTAVLELLDACALEQVDIVAHGLGGALAAGLPPERIRRLVLIAPICFPTELAFGRMLKVPVIGPWLFRGMLRKTEFRAFIESQYSTPELVPKSRFDVYWDRISRDGGVEAAYAMARQLADSGDLSDSYRRIRAPTCFVWGDRDRILPVDDAERGVALVPGARLVVVDGCGHAPQEERPTELAAIVEQHLRAVPSAD